MKEAATEGAIPLDAWSLGRAVDVERTRGLTACAYRRHRLEPRGRGLRFRANRAPLGASFLIACRFGGGGVEIDALDENGFFVEHFVAQGGSRIALDGLWEDCDASRGVVVSPTSRVRLTLDGDCVLMGVRVETERLEAHLALLTGRRPRRSIVFEPGVELRRGAGRRRQRLLQLAIEDLERAAKLERPAGFGWALEEAYLDALLRCQPHSQRQLLEMRHADPGALAVCRVEEYIRAFPERPIRSELLVALSGVNTSTLYEAFKRKRRSSPMRQLREVRLERVRQDLLSAAPGETVTQVALRWGFTHLARFSGQYRARFGELPSQTLSMARLAS